MNLVIDLNKRITNKEIFSFHHAEKDDRKKIAGIDCTYLRDITKIPKTSNTESVGKQGKQNPVLFYFRFCNSFLFSLLGDLLKEFFSYYANFDFKSQGISVYSGQELVKPEYGALYIENPLENMLNVSQNVSVGEVARLRTCMQTSLWKLETYSDLKLNFSWGLCKILEAQSSNNASSKKYGFAFENLFVNKENSVNSAVPTENTELDMYVDKIVETTIRGRNTKSRIKQVSQTEAKSVLRSGWNK